LEIGSADGDDRQVDLARSLIAAVGVPFALAYARERQWHGVIRQIEKLLRSS